MRELFRGKIWIILLALIALVGLDVLASGLSSMQFDQPTNSGGLETIFNFSELVKTEEDVTTLNWVRYLVPVAIVIIFLLFLGPIKPQTSNDLIKQLLKFAVFTFVAMLFMGRIGQNNPFLTGAESTTTASSSQSGLESFTPPTPSENFEFWITALIIVVVGTAAIFLVNRLIDRFIQPKNSLDEIANIARSTLQELSAENISDNAIIQCYVRMNAAVNEWKGITRKEEMTPAEFARELVHAGLPGDAVQTLTRIFERVRYGGHGTGPNEIKEAVTCLTDILKACQARQ